MADWSLLGNFLEEVQEHSTSIGKVHTHTDAHTQNCTDCQLSYLEAPPLVILYQYASRCDIIMTCLKVWNYFKPQLRLNNFVLSGNGNGWYLGSSYPIEMNVKTIQSVRIR